MVEKSGAGQAVHVVLFPAATGCYKFLLLCTLAGLSFLSIAIDTPQIMPYFDGGWAQKWAQSTAG